MNRLPLKIQGYRQRLGVVALVTLLGVLVATPALAEFDLPDVSANRGVSVGTFSFYPRLGLEAGFDSNVFFQADTDVEPSTGDLTANPTNSAVMRIAPGLRIENPNYTDIRLQFDGEGTYRQFFNESVASSQNTFGADIKLGVGFWEKRDASIRLFNDFIRRLDTPNFSTNQNFNRNVNKAGLRAALHPGGVEGRKAFELGAEYAYTIERYEVFNENDTDEHEGRLYAEWRFLPKTFLEFDARLGFRDWAVEDSGAGRVNSMPLRVTTGLNGFITRKLAIRLVGGYGQGFYDSGADFQSFIGAASLTYAPLANTIFSVGYNRDFGDSLWGNFFAYDRVYADIKLRFFGRLEIQLYTAWQLMGFGFFRPRDASSATDVTCEGLQDGSQSAADIPDGVRLRCVNDDRRDDQTLEARVNISVDLGRYIALTASYDYRQRFTAFEITDQNNDLVDVAEYSRHYVLAGLQLRY